MNNKTSPLVSVVIPNYNHARYLGRAIQSVIDQTYSNWEAIVIDNHSTDNTDEVMSSFPDPRITYLKIHNNGVIAASRNVGIRAAKGDWIAFLDSDDCWYPGRLETIINSIKLDHSIDVFSTDEIQVDIAESRSRLLKYGPYRTNFYKFLLTEGNRISTSATIVRHKFMSDSGILFREDPEFVTVEDYDFWMLLAKAGAEFRFIASAQGEATIHSNNSSGQVSRHKQNLINVLKNHVYNIQEFQPNKEKLWGAIYARLLIADIKIQIGNGEYIEGFKLLILAFQISTVSSLKYIFTKFVNRVNRSPWQSL